MRVVLYSRVSTTTQAEDGYSLRQQEAALRQYCRDQGYRVVEAVDDAGYSGSRNDRPGLNRVRELVEADGVDVVLVQDRDRIARDPAITSWLTRLFKDKGCKLVALNDKGDDSPEGELINGVIDQIAKFENAQRTIRMRRGKFQKAREGKTVGGGQPPYGYLYNEARTGLVVDPETMPIVRRIFQMVADGATLHSVKKQLTSDGVPPPGGGAYWHTPSIKRTIQNDVYTGVWWYGKDRVELTHSAGKRRNFTPQPQDHWVGIPVPDAGIPPRMINAARRQVANNTRQGRPGDRFWELGGMLTCGACGSTLTPYSMKDGRSGKQYAYYTCMRRRKEGKKACPDGATYQTHLLEAEIMGHVDGLLADPQRITRQIDEAMAATSAIPPDDQVRAWEAEVAACTQKRAAYQDQQAAGYMTIDELGAKLQELDDTKATAVAELGRLQDGQQRLSNLEDHKRFVLETFGEGIRLGLYHFPPQLRRQLYELLRLKVTVYPGWEMRIEMDMDAQVMQLTAGLEAYAEGMKEADKRIADQLTGEESAEEMHRVVEAELDRVKRSLTNGPDIVMSVVADES